MDHLNLESDYSCSQASSDLPQLKAELESLRTKAIGGMSYDLEQEINRVENQIHFIKNKCSLR
ncbi:DUF2524 domain-containing protein [Paenibacillus alvei]|uniref:DUF2524 domain-containing protein n=1 Tax=Paenibacillus alvei TaxID=44250 RepID=A0ABT4H3W5_PAEAL|nr:MULTISPECIES: hypothetical protein [Paenibacillus]EJW17162.1 hypothetical protein PAV_4c02630 [Paenibacillus alvei DSM 29]MCY7483868.1 DUF2524 domain-containing protein [Paenibacillus alvei]MCY9541484.1 DUF2524 domain-containing protein [Paenibacillus alvei]MCY9705299.1 DUF2524 domain-containing protein [Paenibacillus alvei]MCY9735026.1 DUF2524 domain-containing protein [Paenibacillus alvei]